MKIIQLELNEISKSIIDKMISYGKLTNFKYINSNYKYITTISDSKYEHIEPWIQWVSAHTGKTYDEHKVFNLGDVDQLKYPQIWETLSEQGLKSAIVGSMNVKQGKATDGIFFPDPWAKDGKTMPADLQPLWNLVASKVQTHATSKLKISDLLNGFKCCLKYKIPIKLYIKIAKQIFSQKINPKMKWRMPALFDELLSCIFMTILNKTDFSYYTLFLNACAHYQHHYWRDFYPALFNPKVQTPDISKGDDPISYGYEIYDKILEKVLEYVAKHDNVMLVIASAFTQEPYLASEGQGGMNYYRLNNHAEFLNSLNLNQVTAYPMMSRDWQVNAINPDYRQEAADVLSGIKVSEQALLEVSKNSDNSLFISTAITRAVNDDEPVTLNGNLLGNFNDLFTRIAIKSGHHIKEGSLWISSEIPGFSLSAEEPLTQLYPMTLAAMGLKQNDVLVKEQLEALID